MNKSLDKASPEVLLGLVEQLLAEYAERTERGETVDMQPIERGIAAFCGCLNAMPKDEASKYTQPLEKIMFDLTNLGKLMQNKQRELAASLRDTSTMKKANRAYQTSDSYSLPGDMKKIVKDAPKELPEE